MIEAYPTIKMYNHKSNAKTALQYKGARYETELTRFALKNMRYPFKLNEKPVQKRFLVLTTQLATPKSVFGEIALHFGGETVVFTNFSEFDESKLK